MAVEAPGEDVLSLVDVEVEEGSRTDVVLPDTEIAGWVTGADGNRVPEAGVTIGIAPRGTSKRAGSDGTFRFRGLPAARVTVRAHDPRHGGESDGVPLTLAKNTKIERLELTIEALRKLTGTVVSAGQPVVGARVMAYPESGGTIKKTVTGPDGAFSLSLPEKAQQIIVIVAAPGRTFQGQRATARGGDPIRIDLAGAGGTLLLRARQGSSRRTILYRDAPLLMQEVAMWAYAHDPSQSPFVDSKQPRSPILTVPHMAPGPYRFCATPPSGAEQCRDGILAPGGALELFLD